MDNIQENLMDLEFEILDDIETMIKVKWDSDTLRRDIELKVMERKKIFNDLYSNNGGV